MQDMLKNRYPKGHALFYNTAKQTMFLGVKYQGYISLHRDSKVLLFYCIELDTNPLNSSSIKAQPVIGDVRHGQEALKTHDHSIRFNAAQHKHNI